MQHFEVTPAKNLTRRKSLRIEINTLRTGDADLRF